MRWNFAFLTAIFVTATFVVAQTPKNLEALKGKTVPDFQLRSIEGKVQKFSQFRGKVILLNFWSPY
ncbi:MAG: TlpA family protein disulfide reductase [Armatimonadota bacterium]